MDNTRSVLGSNPVVRSDGGWLLIAMLISLRARMRQPQSAG